MSARRTLFGLVAVLACGVAGCHREPSPQVRARFGVFFGGEVQEREQIPLVLDRARQAIGIRLEFANPPAPERPITWELDKPVGKKATDTTRVVAYGEARTRGGDSVLDVPLAFQPGDRPGAWRIRVAFEGARVLDRAFTVTPASDAANGD